MRPMQERVWEKRGEQHLLIKSPPASGKSRALMFIALDKLHNQGIRQAIVAVPERTIGASFNDEPLSRSGFWADWTVPPKWNLCNAPGTDGGKVNSVKAFLDSDDRALICTHATFRFAVERFGVEAFDDRLIAIDEFHHVSANPDNKLGQHLVQFLERDRVHIVAMTGSYFRGDAEPVLMPRDEASGTIYVLRSKSDHPDICKNRNLIHKIGATNTEVKTRIANTQLDPTFLMADVKVVSTYQLYNIDCNKLEHLIHRIFAPARLKIEIKDRFGKPVMPQEWFLVPLDAIDEAVRKIQEGTITRYCYDVETASLVET